MRTFLKIQIEIASQDQAEIFIAELSEINYYAFDQEDNFLNAYVIAEDFDEKKLKEILPGDVLFSKSVIEEQNWNKWWESEIEPVRINDFVAIRPSFCPPISGVQHDLVITPKMSFGTGHHPTTCLMIELMQRLDFIGKTVIDFGTGTGVLAILAEKCGASKITAVDNDQWSIENAMENIELNECANIKLQRQDNLFQLDKADIILANINLNVIKNESLSIASAAKSGAFLLVAGFLETDQEEMLTLFETKGFVKTDSIKAGDWVAFLFENP